MPIAEPLSASRKRLPIRPRTDDAALVRRMRTGEESAFEAIYKRHNAPLLSYCRHLLGNQTEGEDALQQAFIKAHQALLGGSSPRELRPWLYAIARNCCLTAIAARRGRTGTESLLEEDQAPALAGLSEQVQQREDLRELVAGIGRLPEDQRSALLLAELDDLDHRAIATIVGCEVSKVKALIYQARSALIADRDARETPCQDIREQLAVAHGGELRRGPLRRHLKLCVGCRDFQLAVGAQRQSLGLLLPVLPSAGLTAAILGHGATHAATVASIGHAGAAGLAPSAGAGGAGVGATATGTGASAAGAGASATGAAAASGTAVSAGGTAAAGASAGAGGGTGIGALLGGGLVTKLAVGGAVVALATAGTVAVHNRPAHAMPNGAVRSERAAAGTPALESMATNVADVSVTRSGSLGPGSPAGLPLIGATAPVGSPGSGPGSSPELSALTGVNPILTASSTPAPPSLVLSAIPGRPAVNSGASGTGARAPGHSLRGSANRHRAALEHRRLRAARLRHLAALRRARLREAKLRRLAALRLARLREAALRRAAARREALHRKSGTAPKTTPAAAPPAPTGGVRRHKAHSTAPAGRTETAGSTSGSTSTGTGGTRRHPARGGTTGSGTGKTSETGTGTKGSGKVGSPTQSSGTGTGTGKTGAGTGKTGAGTGKTGAGTGKTGAGTGRTGSGKTGSAAGGEKLASSKTGTGGAAGASETGSSKAAPEKATPGEPGNGGSSEPGSKTAAPKKNLVSEGQLPNL